MRPMIKTFLNLIDFACFGRKSQMLPKDWRDRDMLREIFSKNSESLGKKRGESARVGAL